MRDLPRGGTVAHYMRYLVHRVPRGGHRDLMRVKDNASVVRRAVPSRRFRESEERAQPAPFSGGSGIYAASIVTTDANELVAEVDRMRFIVPPCD